MCVAIQSKKNWMACVYRLWPLFIPAFQIVENQQWYSIYNALMASTPCKPCLMDRVKFEGNISEARTRRLRLELRTQTPEGVWVKLIDTFNWSGAIFGPVGSPYEGGIFYLNIEVPSEYPFKSPRYRFVTKIFHPNISRHGDVGLNFNESIVSFISYHLLYIQSILSDPIVQTYMEPSIGLLYEENRQRYYSIAKSWTNRFAKHHTP